MTKLSKSLPSHKAQYPMRSDREYVAFERGYLCDIAQGLRHLSTVLEEPLQSILKEFSQQLEQPVYDSRALDQIKEGARTAAWGLLHTRKEGAGSAVLLLLSGLCGGNRLERKEQK